jgi:hypothetical protein
MLLQTVSSGILAAAAMQTKLEMPDCSKWCTKKSVLEQGHMLCWEDSCSEQKELGQAREGPEMKEGNSKPGRTRHKQKMRSRLSTRKEDNSDFVEQANKCA